MCERFFGTAGLDMTSRRNDILPSNIEGQLFLHMKRAFWNIEDAKLYCQRINDTVI